MMPPRGAFKGAETAVADGMPIVKRQVFMAGEHTVSAVDNASDEVALFVDIGYALTVDHSLGLCRQLGPDGFYGLFYGSHLVEGDRGTCVTFYTAGTVTGIEVTAELFADDVRRDEYIAYLQDGGKGVQDEK